jgi:hypothetical protein
MQLFIVRAVKQKLAELLVSQHDKEGHHVYVLREQDVVLGVGLDGFKHPLCDLVVLVVLQ